jgi:hypothetical protein
MTEPMVLGESLFELATSLYDMEWQPSTDGQIEIRGEMPMDGPLSRALFRAEAELLLDDVDAMTAGTWEYRTQAERGADAFVLLTQRLTSAAEEYVSRPAT